MAKDLFSQQAASYAGFRPGYPASLIEHILHFTTGRSNAWDCATGNGQAATLLAPYFDFNMCFEISVINHLTEFPDLLIGMFNKLLPAESRIHAHQANDLYVMQDVGK